MKNIELPSDVLLVDLDTNEVTLPRDIKIPLFPEPENSNLKDVFHKALGKMTPLETNSKQKETPSVYIADSDEIDVAARVAMVNYYLNN